MMIRQLPVRLLQLFFLVLLIGPASALFAAPPRYVLHGLNFSPYIDPGEDPNRGEGQITARELRERLQRVAASTRWIRTFGCDDDLRPAGRIAHELGLQTAIGAWLGTHAGENRRQIECLVEEAAAGHVDLAIVGSEVLLRGDLSEAALLDHLAEVKASFAAAGLDVPVTTADVYGILLDHPAVLEAVDVVLVNYYPYWEGRPLDRAMAHVHHWHQQILAAARGKEVIVSESGWPSCGEQIGEAVPSAENAALYFLNFVSWARANQVPYFYFETYDEAWKVRFEGPQGGCWGVWNRTGVLKEGMAAVFAGERLPDNWSDPPAEEPIIDFLTQPAVTTTNLPAFLVASHTQPDHRVLINGAPLSPRAMDEEGNFAAVLPLAVGDNVIELRVETSRGDPILQQVKVITYDPAFSTLDRRLVYVDVVDVENGGQLDRPELSGTAVIDLDGNALLGFLDGVHVRGISPDATEIYIEENRAMGTDFHNVRRVLPFSRTLPGNGFLVSPDGRRLYSRQEIVEVASNRLLPASLPRSIETTGSWSGAPLPGDPAISADGRIIYCCSDVAKIDTETLEVVDRRGSTLHFETDLSLLRDESMLLVADYSFANGRLKAYDRSDLSSQLQSVTGLGDFVGEIALSASGDRAVVGSAGNPSSASDGRLTVVDLTDWEILSQEQVPLADNLVASGNDEFLVASGESGLLRRLGVQAFVLEPAGTLVRSKTFFLGVNRHERSSGRPRNDRIRKLVFKRPGPCTPGPQVLCLGEGRFRVEVSWRTPSARTGAARAVPLTGDTGAFWFFDQENLELVIKVLEACTVNDHIWVFAGGLTNVEVEIRVTDTATGLIKTYAHPQGVAFPPLQDTRAFPSCQRGAGSQNEMDVEAGSTTARTTELFLNDGRFRVMAEWRTPRGRSGRGMGRSLTPDTGYFWFFDDDNVEFLIKVLDGCAVNERYWVFAGGLTNVRVEITVEDTLNGTTRTYLNPQGAAFQPIQDTRAFPACP